MKSSAGSAAGMAVDFIVAPEAAADLDEAYAWYERQRSGLGEEFLGCVEARIEQICRNPEWFPTVHEQYRRALVRRFPYAVFYELAGEMVTIYSIFHTARDPSKWRQRLP
jgi:plasmid stabilization system protein ParE